jgi:phosphoribosylanthranilate isomerase
MSVFVKICGMTDVAAVRAAADAGADAVGFVFFEKSPRNLRPADAAALAASVPAGVLTVAVTLHPDPSLWSQVQSTLRPDVLQTDLDDFDSLDVDDAIEKWPVLREGSLPDVIPDTFVYEGARSGSGTTVDWHAAATLSAGRRMILAGGLSVDNVADAVRTVRPWGVDVSSAVESTRGVKDVAKIQAFVTAAKAAGESPR